MKRIAIALGALFVPLSVHAEEANLPAAYVEGSVGGSFIPTVQTNTITLTDGINTAIGHANLSYSNALTEGAEIGVAGVFIPEIRLGVSWEHLELRFDNGSVAGTVNGTPGSLSFTRADLTSVGFSSGALDTRANVVTANVYYSLPLIDFGQPWQMRPYLGVGLGETGLANAGNNFTVTGTAGIRASVSETAYVGVRYRYYHVSGPTDKILDVPFNAVTNHSIMAVFGFYLN